MKKIILLWVLSVSWIHAQEKKVENEGQVWVGYMTSVKLNNHFSIWNDFHYASDNFFLARHGLTYNFSKQVSVTGGFAWGYLSTSSTNQLVRGELRPWAQLMFNSKLDDYWQTQQRIRYDARYKEDIENGEIVHGKYTFNHRLRYMLNVRRTIDGQPFGPHSTFLSLNNEILVNFGKNIHSNNLDQFRASLLVGKSFDNITVQLGYMYRYVPQGTADSYKNYHGLTLWVNQNFKTKKGAEETVRHQ